MLALEDLEFLSVVANAASLSEAARLVGVSPAAASASLLRIEKQLGTKLFVRTTRSLRPTHDALVFLERCRSGLDIIASARSQLQAGRYELQGRLQLSLPSDLGRHVVLAWLEDFQQQYPGVNLHLQFSDRLAEVHRNPVDATLRYGVPPDSSLVALPLVPNNHRVVCAAPSYLARQGQPRTPAELSEHDCLCFMLGDKAHDRWQFSQGKHTLTVAVRAHIQCDDGDAVRRLAVHGRGIAYKSMLDVWPDLQAGRLQALLPQWTGEAAPLYLVCPDRAHLKPLLKTLHAFLQSRFAEFVAQPSTIGA
ncbi:LysR family transcriptional regulator [Curvibacter sp. CHRR-16]|uniref:LysR family transcriptional regulator n=1 Tax=Curvibacter sp. CHRR-16 TaxID=2835872 RepID=UPI001BDB2743|nr:LysR family transcriptional regulator [Curvibacter sp. CHRR-16]MBT0569263.1 LysR family transcriptional regulator [Curvibacter sp. CHRR-16]